MINIGQRITAIRADKGLTQVELSRRAGIRVAYISDLETGRKPNPTVATLVALANALDVPVTALVQQEDATKVA